MPTYIYRCKKCGYVFEKEFKVNEVKKNLHSPKLQKCPKCRGEVNRVYTSPSLKFVGSGFYINDYKGK